ncbi:MAG: hypothetical protein DRJ31_05415, partial [Candidatus Methanomethylicota archaeon]
MSGYVAIAGDAINWFWSFRDYGIKELSKAFVDDSEPPKRLTELKRENWVLWGFHSREDYRKLSEWVRSYNVLNVVMVANSIAGLSKRGVIGFGKVSNDMLIGEVRWDYWPKPPKGHGKWDYKFYIEVEAIIPEVINNASVLKSLNKTLFTYDIPSDTLAEIIRKCSSYVVTLIPSNITQGSSFLIKEEEYNLLKDIALDRWGVTGLRVKRLKVNLEDILKVVERYGLYYPRDVLVNALAALRSGKHLLLMGAPATGKSMLAKVLAEALGYELYACTASSAWTRYDFIGGPVLGENGRLEWRSGHLLKALARHFELEERGGGVLLLIEELNRAEADKVLAEFFTMFPSSNYRDWKFPEGLAKEILSFKTREDALDEDAKRLLEYLERSNYMIPGGFRVIATVNSFDRAYLFTLGYALQRRFVVLEIFPPNNPEDEIRAIIEQFRRKNIHVDDVVK